MKKKGIGFDIPSPKEKCSDQKCPFHGSISVRKKSFTGIITSDKMAGTVIVAWGRRVRVPKYERYEKRKSKVPAHNPKCINAKKGDVVLISETRPLSKTKHFVVVKILGEESKTSKLKEEDIEEAKSLDQQKVRQKDAGAEDVKDNDVKKIKEFKEPSENNKMKTKSEEK